MRHATVNRYWHVLRRCLKHCSFLLLVLLPVVADAQTLRYSNHRELDVPEYATVRIGPFYSDVSFSQSAGYRYTSSRGAGVDFLEYNRRGVIREDGEEYPLMTTLGFRNYLLISRRADLDLSISMRYEHYPLDTQDDAFSIDLAEEGIIGDLSFMVALTPSMKMTVYDAFVYKTDYIDTRGIADPYGGQEYEYIRNTVGLNSDWLLTEDSNLGVSLSRSDNLPKDDMFMEQESVSYTEAFLYERKLGPFVSAGARADFAQTDYTSTNRADPSSRQYSIYSGVQLTERTRASANVGYSMASLENASGTEDLPGAYVGGASMQTELSPSLSHSMSYSHSRRESFLPGYDMQNGYTYQLQWKGVDSGLVLHAGYTTFDPSDSNVNGYSDLSVGLSGTVPLVLRLLVLQASTTYSSRNNDQPTDDTIDEIEWIADYETWVSSLGTGLRVSENVDFSVQYQHIERWADAAELDYTRDILSATLTYSCTF